MDEELLAEFYAEAEHLLTESEEALLELEKDHKNKDSFNQLFRAFHSLKGAAGMFEILNLQELMHFLESFVEKIPTFDKVKPTIFDYVLRGVDTAKEMLKGENPEFEKIEIEEFFFGIQ